MKAKWHLRYVLKMPQSMIRGQIPMLFVLLLTISFLPRAWGQDMSSPQSPQAPQALQSPQSSQAAQIVIPEKSYNFKEVEEGKTIEHSFTILNKGSEPLKIIKVRPG